MATQELQPGNLLKTSGSYWETCTLHAGVKLGVFTLLGNQQLSSKEVTEKLDGDKRGVEMLLNALAAMDLLEKKGDTYCNTPVSTAFLSKESSRYIGHIIRHHHHLVDSWSRLDVAVQSGKPVRTRASHHEDEKRESFLMGMFNLAMNLAPIIVPKIDLSNRRHLLDLGGGPGTYAIHFCLHNPRLKQDYQDGCIISVAKEPHNSADLEARTG